ncbi:MAG: hypothetical protein ABIR47_17480, partial [Candidatus Kapaibacterium sp.]
MLLDNRILILLAEPLGRTLHHTTLDLPVCNILVICEGKLSEQCAGDRYRILGASEEEWGLSPECVLQVLAGIPTVSPILSNISGAVVSIRV